MNMEYAQRINGKKNTIDTVYYRFKSFFFWSVYRTYTHTDAEK